MRTILLTLLLLTLIACAGKEDVPVDGAATESTQAEESAQAEESVDEAAATGADEIAGVAMEEVATGPIGNIRLRDGSVIEIIEFKKLGKYYLYISGKLNGRSSTVISFTRLRDVQHWAMFEFKDPYNFIITTRKGNELRFLDSRIYIGSKSHETYSFYTTNGFEKELIKVEKADVASITIN